MIGVDITTISRFENAKNSLIKKILHPKEIKQYLKSNNKEYFLAGRWAIKEALFKADNKFFKFNKLNIIKENGKYLFDEYEITTSSENDLYIAFVSKKGK